MRAGVSDAERASRRSVEIYEALYRQTPENVEIKPRYAGSLCSIGKYAQAKRLVDARVPNHPYASQLARFIEAQAPGVAARPGPDKQSWFSKVFGKNLGN